MEAVHVIGDYIVEVFLCDDGHPGITVAKATLEQWTDPEGYLKKDPPYVDIFVSVENGKMSVRHI